MALVFISLRCLEPVGLSKKLAPNRIKCLLEPRILYLKKLDFSRFLKIIKLLRIYSFCLINMRSLSGLQELLLYTPASKNKKVHGNKECYCRKSHRQSLEGKSYCIEKVKWSYVHPPSSVKGANEEKFQYFLFRKRR